jgi:hypothetical protein
MIIEMTEFSDQSFATALPQLGPLLLALLEHQVVSHGVSTEHAIRFMVG